MEKKPIIVEMEEQTSSDLYARLIKVLVAIVHEECKNVKGGTDTDA